MRHTLQGVLASTRQTSIRSLVLLGALIVIGAMGCGAKTGLKIPDAEVETRVDAGTEPPDALPDAPADACAPRSSPLRPLGAQVLFALDRSTSMDQTLDGREPEEGEQTRWELLRGALANTLRGRDLLKIGGLRFPQPIEDDTPTAEEICAPPAGVELQPKEDNLRELLQLFDRDEPGGGTPTAETIGVARDFFLSQPPAEIPRFIVLATDGGPNCNPNTGVPPTECTCTGNPEDCADQPDFGPYNCLDDERTVRMIRTTADAGIPVFVIGIDDPSRPDLNAVLDRMAVAGDVPRPDDDGRRYYSVRRSGDLQEALNTITENISDCLLGVSEPPQADERTIVRVDGEPVPRDDMQREGWGWIDREAGELRLFGTACDRASRGGAEVEAEFVCAADAGGP